jgi:hypothetical protein
MLFDARLCQTGTLYCTLYSDMNSGVLAPHAHTTICKSKRLLEGLARYYTAGWYTDRIRVSII